MPIDSSSFHTPVLFGGVNVLAGIVPNHEKEDQTSKDVEGMHACHHIEDSASRAAAGRKTLFSSQRPFHSQPPHQAKSRGQAQR